MKLPCCGGIRINRQNIVSATNVAAIDSQLKLSLVHSKIIFKALLLLLFIGTLSPLAAQDKPLLNLEDPSQNQPQTYTIQEVVVRGVEENRAFIVATAGLEEGKQIRIPGPGISNAVKVLYRTGLFSDVKVFITQKVGSSVFLEVVLKPQPRLQGYKLKNVKDDEKDELKPMIPLMNGFAITEGSVEQTVKTIKRFFKERGYWYTEVKVKEKVIDEERNRVRLVFNVKKGERLRVVDIRFDGNEEFSGKELRKAMGELKERRWWRFWSKETLTKEKMEESKANLESFYRREGFRDFRIKSDSVWTAEQDGKERVFVELSIHEGPRYYVRNIEWEGNTVYEDERLTQALGFKKGDVFNQERFEQNLNINKNNTDVTSLYQDVGYLFMQIQQEIDVVGEDSLDLSFSINEDEVATIQEVDFSGNTRTHDNVIRRNLRTIPGAKYSRTNIQRSLRELATLSYFVPESIQPELDYDYQAKEVSIYYRMREMAGTDNFELQGGYGGPQVGLIFSTRLNFNNFSMQNIDNFDAWTPLPSGDGQKLSLGAQVTGGGYQNFSLSFQEPWLFGKPNSFGISASYSLYKTSATRDEVFSSSVSYGQRLEFPDDYFTHTTAVQYQAYDVAGSFFNEDGNFYVLSLKQILERNSLDNFISPTQGSKLTLSGEIAPPFGNFAQYYKLGAKFQFHVPVVAKLVFSSGTEFGHLGYLSSKDQSPFERFYLGGTPLQQRQTFTRDNIDLRGYPGGTGGSISPLNSTGSAIGGNNYVKYMAEMRYPLVQNEQMQFIPYMFADAGQAYNGFNDFAPFDVKRAAGFGVRFYLPILGLIDLSYGYRFDGIPNTDVRPGKWEFLFNIGPAF